MYNTAELKTSKHDWRKNLKTVNKWSGILLNTVVGTT
jgi:hypothetical protein